MDDALRAAIAARANFACEYCLIYEQDDVYAFHVEHIIAVKHSGSSDTDNLAYACQHCNLHKGTNLSGIDPETGKIVQLFHPRKDRWADHFVMNRSVVIGLTPIGRTTVRVLVMNASSRAGLRELLGYHGVNAQ